MGNQFLSELVNREIKEIVTKMGFEIVEAGAGRTSGMTKIIIIIYNNNGVSLHDCEKVSKIVLPRLEMIGMPDNLSVEVSSPGTDRVIKRKDEYRIFKGRGVIIYYGNKDVPVKGVISDFLADKNIVRIKRAKDLTDINIDTIRKAKLYDYQEVEK